MCGLKKTAYGTNLGRMISVVRLKFHTGCDIVAHI